MKYKFLTTKSVKYLRWEIEFSDKIYWHGVRGSYQNSNADSNTRSSFSFNPILCERLIVHILYSQLSVLSKGSGLK
jgi:hypothetical protein